MKSKSMMSPLSGLAKAMVKVVDYEKNSQFVDQDFKGFVEFLHKLSSKDLSKIMFLCMLFVSHIGALNRNDSAVSIFAKEISDMVNKEVCKRRGCETCDEEGCNVHNPTGELLVEMIEEPKAETWYREEVDPDDLGGRPPIGNA